MGGVWPRGSYPPADVGQVREHRGLYKVVVRLGATGSGYVCSDGYDWMSEDIATWPLYRPWADPATPPAPSEAEAAAFARGREAERADVVAWLETEATCNHGVSLAATPYEIANGAHIGAADKDKEAGKR